MSAGCAIRPADMRQERSGRRTVRSSLAGGLGVLGRVVEVQRRNGSEDTSGTDDASTASAAGWESLGGWSRSNACNGSEDTSGTDDASIASAAGWESRECGRGLMPATDPTEPPLRTTRPPHRRRAGSASGVWSRSNACNGSEDTSSINNASTAPAPSRTAKYLGRR